MKNAEWMIKNGMSFSNLKCANINGKNIVYYDDYPHELLYFEYGQPKDIVTKWLDMEHREQILDEVEKRYMASVIRPFRDRAIFVKKTYRNGFNNVAYEQIFIRVKSIATDIADIPFPFFKKGEMYKGMKLEREYTLEELGLKGL